MELVVVLGGTGRHVGSFEPAELRAGTALLIRPGVWHAYSGCAKLELVNFCFPLAVARSEWRSLLSDRIRVLLRLGDGLKVAELPPETLDAMDRLERVERTETGANGLVIWMLDRFAAAFPGLAASMHPAVEAAVCALEEHPGRDWTVQELAAEAGLDRAYLSRLFRRNIGVAPMAYLISLRMERAAALLAGTSLGCGEIAVEVGYADPNLFSRRFRARFGKSPSEYRAAVRSARTAAP